jgi:hypothetical protein
MDKIGGMKNTAVSMPEPLLLMLMFTLHESKFVVGLKHLPVGP